MGLLRHLFFCKRHLHLFERTAVGVVLLVMLTACGDTFRPVANPIPRPGGDPGVAGDAIILGANGTSPGTTAHVNTSGDTVVAVENVGVNPVHAIVVGAGLEVVVANEGSDTLSAYSASAGPNASVSTFGLPTPTMAPPGTKPQPVFLATTDNTNVYVAEQGANAIGVIPFATLTAGPNACSAMQPAPCVIMDASISAPVAIAQLPGGGKIYVANQNSNQVTVIDPTTLAVKTAINVGNSPSAIVASSDGSCVYVANQNSNSVTVINATNDTANATAISVGSGPNFLRFDSRLQRVYVANNRGNTISVINHATDCSAATATSVMVGTHPASIAVLSDKTRAYVANFGDGTVSVIDVSSNTVRKTIPLPGSTPMSIGASSDATKVYVADSAGSIAIIRTSDDTVLFRFTATSNPPLPGAPNPRFVLMNP